MKRKEALVWYACYGSNLFFKRFSVYITGGRSRQIPRDYPGCVNKNLPKKNHAYYLPMTLYFAGKSQTWEDKSVAFIKDSGNATQRTLGRAYLITKEQFYNILLQENGENDFSNAPMLDLNLAQKEGAVFLGDASQYPYYGKVLYLDEMDGYPVFTFTAKKKAKKNEVSRPSDKYLSFIIKGICQTFNYSKDEIFSYLMDVEGLKNCITTHEINTLTDEALREVRSGG